MWHWSNALEIWNFIVEMATSPKKFRKQVSKKGWNGFLNMFFQTEDEFNTLIKKMENYEGWHPWPEGEEYTPMQKIIGVKMKNHKITSYLVLAPPEKRWIIREEAVNLAENRLLRAVVVHNKNQIYLRPFPHETPYRDRAC